MRRLRTILTAAVALGSGCPGQAQFVSPLAHAAPQPARPPSRAETVRMVRDEIAAVKQARQAMVSVNFLPMQQQVTAQVQQQAAAYEPTGNFGTGYGMTYTPDQCEAYMRSAEREYRIPPFLLHAISLTESGRNGRPNPYAMNIGGRAYFAPDVGTMERIVNQNWGVQNVDVGCMQISVKFHAQRFKDWRSLLNPQYNVEYAALYLTELHRELGTWTRAVGAYHSRTSWKGANYVCLVSRRYGQMFGDTRPGCGPNLEAMTNLMYGSVSWTS